LGRQLFLYQSLNIGQPAMNSKHKEILGLVLLLGLAAAFVLWFELPGDSENRSGEGSIKSPPVGAASQSKQSSKAHARNKNFNPNSNPVRRSDKGPDGRQEDSNERSPWADSKGRINIRDGAVVVGLDYLTRRSSRIVLGIVTDVKAAPGPNGELIFTYFTVAVRQSLKGSKSDAVTIRVLGGALPGRPVLRASHQPKLQLGDEGLFFIDDNPKLWTSLVGSAQGFLRIKRPAPTETAVWDGFENAIFAIDKDQRFVSKPGLDNPKAMTEAEILRLLGQQLR
jgi:hypothetical protein